MSTLSVRLPDDVANRLKDSANNRNVSLNELISELSTRALLEEETKQQFIAAQLRENRKRGLQILDELGSNVGINYLMHFTKPLTNERN